MISGSIVGIGTSHIPSSGRYPGRIGSCAILRGPVGGGALRFLSARAGALLMISSADCKVPPENVPLLRTTPSIVIAALRSEERRVGKECSSRGWPCHEKKNETRQTSGTENLVDGG